MYIEYMSERSLSTPAVVRSVSGLHDAFVNGSGVAAVQGARNRAVDAIERFMGDPSVVHVLSFLGEGFDESGRFVIPST